MELLQECDVLNETGSWPGLRSLFHLNFQVQTMDLKGWVFQSFFVIG